MDNFAELKNSQSRVYEMMVTVRGAAAGIKRKALDLSFRSTIRGGDPAPQRRFRAEQGRWEMIENELERVSRLILMCAMDEPHYVPQQHPKRARAGALATARAGGYGSGAAAASAASGASGNDWWKAPKVVAVEPVEIPSLNSSAAADDIRTASEQIESYEHQVAEAEMDAAVMAAVRRGAERAAEHAAMRKAAERQRTRRAAARRASLIPTSEPSRRCGLGDALDELPDPCGFGMMDGILTTSKMVSE